MPTALLSVYDKSGIAAFAAELSALGWSLVSSGGTARAIADAGVEVTDVVELTGVPAILGHRVVTLHPKVHGGILANTDDAEHRADMDAYGIEAIDLVVGNLYPFSSDPSIELIDIGGPAMVRAAAKNHDRVGIIVDPADYTPVLDELRQAGALSAATRRRLARAAFAHTAAYDAAIVTWFDETDDTFDKAAETDGDAEADAALPASLHFALDNVQPLRYGENPHQAGARYRQVGATGWWDSMTQHGGKALSYLNVFDTEAAWRLVNRFDDPACVVVKHANPCGVAVADNATDAYVRANACDPVSAFGGIVAINRAVPASLASALIEVFTEVVVAPSFDDDALEILASKKNLRVISANPPSVLPFDVRPVDGGLLVQQPDLVSGRSDAWRVVTDVAPSDAQWAELEFAWQVC
ncbi:MAG: bifunctional phosphoribosylaminoimidazolecarboxamide formyltransferase/IMP cyclohydrolase, partial [Actinomycetota bacterium]